MDNPQHLSGAQIVARGVSRLAVTLPELGLKETIPNGSWLEQKQIQAALEARKHLVEVERIEKSVFEHGNECTSVYRALLLTDPNFRKNQSRGVLSQAEWDEDLMLAKVIQQVGGHWQYIGHNIGKHLYLKPEEALFLMEMNGLQLKYNGVPVSVQQAYSLLLRGVITISKYHVYASLGRLGYKVFRHIQPLFQDVEMQVTESDEIINKEIVNDPTNKEFETTTATPKTKIAVVKENDATDKENIELAQRTVNDDIVDSTSNKTDDIVDNTHKKSINNNIGSEIKRNSVNINVSSESEKCLDHGVGDKLDSDIEIEATSGLPDVSIINSAEDDDITIVEHESFVPYCNEKTKALQRKNKIKNRKDLTKYFDNFPNLCQKTSVTINVPDKLLLPENVSCNKSYYFINLENITKKTERPSQSYSVSDEVNGTNVRRISNSRGNESIQSNNNFPSSPQFRPFFNRPARHLNFFQMPLFFQRPFVPHFGFGNPRFNFLFQNRMFMRQFRMNFAPPNLNVNYLHTNDSSINFKRRNHINAIKNVASRLKNLSSSVQPQHIRALQNLIGLYNNRYKRNLSLARNFELVDNSEVVETINLDEDGEVAAKKPRLDTTDYDKHFNLLKEMTTKIKNLEGSKTITTRHKRALSKAIKTFNIAFSADLYLNNKYEILNKKQIILDSSDSDCIIKEAPKRKQKKKLKNPFNIMKRLSEINNLPEGNTSMEIDNNQVLESNHDDSLKQVFNNWLPPGNDFGRASLKVCTSKNIDRNFALDCNDQLLYEFIKSQSSSFESWEEIKQNFVEHLDKTSAVLENESLIANNLDLKSLIKPEDCTNLSTVLNKLSIIKAYKDIVNETSLYIDFDVYNRDVPNFRKTNPPKPHFRVICLNESEKIPSPADITSLHMKYKDDVTIIFAIVGNGSISYLQLNPIETPVYLPSNDPI